jgi:hypothetical protein
MIRRRTPLKRSAAPERRSPVKKKRAAPRRVSVLRDREYLDWLRDRGCVACERAIRRFGDLRVDKDTRIFAELSDPAHYRVNGRGSKGPDNEAISLCRHHHDEQHQIGWPAFEAKYGFSREKEAAAHWAAFQLTKETP